MDPVKTLDQTNDSSTTNLGPTKRRIVERLKRADAKVSDLAVALDMTEAGVRQHLDALADHGLVVSRTGPADGRGRPPTVWALTDLAQDLFPDRHDDLTVELITAVRTALGDKGLAQVIDARAEVQRAAYERAVPKRGTVARAASRRSRASAPRRATSPRSSTIPKAAACSSSSTTARSAPRPRRARACAARSSRSSARCSVRRCRSSARSTSSRAIAGAPT